MGMSKKDEENVSGFTGDIKVFLRQKDFNSALILIDDLKRYIKKMSPRKEVVRRVKDKYPKHYQYNCVNPKSLIELECIIANERSIPYRTFIKNVDKKEVEEFDENFGIPLKDEQFASFHKSITPKGKIVYYFKHSAIEYVFY